ncbi:hypothetical protein V8G54_009832 [Vigna mungo]|uniref:GRF-type domain-containing protein n=1 Tax=Vigna mungo TaxID=3915 RepID=A0AAQ3NVX4_VIGMU
MKLNIGFFIKLRGIGFSKGGTDCSVFVGEEDWEACEFSKEGSAIAEKEKMSMGHSCSSSTCNQCGRKHLHSVSCRGDGSWNRNDGLIICHCGESCVLRTAKTVKNRGKKFWGCPRYKVGSENGGCNYFRWCTDWGIEESVSCEVLEANDERLVKGFENERDKKIASV